MSDAVTGWHTSTELPTPQTRQLPSRKRLILRKSTKLKVTEIVVLKSTQKGLPAPDSDASYNCGFSKGKWPGASRHDGAAYRRHPWRQSANANIVFALPLRLNHFPRKSQSLRRIYVRGSSPFLLVYEKHPNCLGNLFEIHVQKLKTRI